MLQPERPTVRAAVVGIIVSERKIRIIGKVTSAAAALQR
jgi:hypothetical protein